MMDTDDRARLASDDLTIGYDKDLVSSISLSVAPGRIVTLIGPNGCGKSTLLRTVTGQIKSRGGVVLLDGKDMSLTPLRERARKMSLVMTQKARPQLMTCREVVETGRYPYTGITGKLSEADERAVETAMEMTGTSELSAMLITNISDGQAQRVMLAAAIAQEPDVLVLDEPVSYLDIKYKIDILKKIKTLAQERNIAVLMSLHEPEIAMRLSDTVVAMGEGRVLRMGAPSDVFEETFIRRLYGLGDEDVSILGSKPWMSVRAGSAYAPSGGVIMVMGTMSGVGKSVITAGLCRIFARDGLRVAPFKSQNMANNSFVTDEGLEMGRAQVMQAQCAKTRPRAIMNPVLLKPVDDCGSQVVVNGRAVGNMKAAQYHEYKKTLIPVIRSAFDELFRDNDVIVVEGAGSPVEINLRSNDIVNMGLAEMIDAPVILVGDIDRGGVFAQLLGTLDLLSDDERARVVGIIVNKFRGDKELLLPGIRELEKRAGCPVLGIVPFTDLNLDDEDSLSDRFRKKEPGAFDIAVIRFPHISNYTDLDIFEQAGDVSIRYVSDPADMLDPDLIILPGTKNTIGDMKWMKDRRLDAAVKDMAEKGRVIIGICGGFQMLGRSISDPEAAESGGSIEGLNLLAVDTVMSPDKTQRAYSGRIEGATGVLEGLRDFDVRGYEIHMGESVPLEELCPFTSDNSGYCRGNVYGSYVHGLFDRSEIASGIIRAVAADRGRTVDTDVIIDMDDLREREYDRLADTLAENLDMEAIYRIVLPKKVADE